MPQSVVGKWGKDLAIRVPMDIARAAGLTDGEKVQVETQHGDIVVRRRAFRAHAQAQAAAAAEEIIAQSSAYKLGDISPVSFLRHPPPKTPHFPLDRTQPATPPNPPASPPPNESNPLPPIGQHTCPLCHVSQTTAKLSYC